MYNVCKVLYYSMDYYSIKGTEGSGGKYASMGDIVLFMGDTKLYIIKSFNRMTPTCTLIEIPSNVDEVYKILDKRTYTKIKRPLNRLLFLDEPMALEALPFNLEYFSDTLEDCTYCNCLIRSISGMITGKITIPRTSDDLRLTENADEQIKEYFNKSLYPGWKLSLKKYTSYVKYMDLLYKTRTLPVLEALETYNKLNPLLKRRFLLKLSLEDTNLEMATIDKFYSHYY